MKENFKGFTLAEVLITLTIIGVIAALTVPNLYAYYQKQQYVTELKKVYTELSQALKQMMADEGVNKLSTSTILTHQDQDGEEYSVAGQRAGNYFLKKYFKIIKDCGTENPSPCFAESYKNFNFGTPPACEYSVITVGGASICISILANSNMPGTFTVDINGLKPPNTGGRDIFYISYYYDGSLDEGVTPECKQGIANASSGICRTAYNNAQELRQGRFEAGCPSENAYGYGCFGKIINDNWKMDY